MANEKKVKVINYEVAWLELQDNLSGRVRALAEASVSPSNAEYCSGRLSAFESVLSLMVLLEALYEKAE